jgi:transcriptional regulator with XRE-family HTH domain
MEKPTEKGIAHRLCEIRKLKGYTQEETAKAIGVSRTVLTQMELGKRKIDALELMTLSSFLGFSLDTFMIPEPEYKEENVLQETMTVYAKREIQQERISVPEFKKEKFKNVLLYVLERCAGKPNVGETVLYKLLYFSDFNYYELYEEQLTGAEYRKLPHGPVPTNVSSILNEMVSKGELQRIKTEYHGFPQTRFLPLSKADLTRLKASEKVVIDAVIDQMSDWNASTISQYSHGDKPWKATSLNDRIDYELVFYRQLPYSVRGYEDNGND